MNRRSHDLKPGFYFNLTDNNHHGSIGNHHFLTVYHVNVISTYENYQQNQQKSGTFLENKVGMLKTNNSNKIQKLSFLVYFFIRGHVIYKPAYTYKFQLKTTIEEKMSLWF